MNVSPKWLLVGYRQLLLRTGWRLRDSGANHSVSRAPVQNGERAMRDGPRHLKQIPPNEQKEPTPQELAEQFAADAVKAALAPPLDGLNILDEIRRGFRPLKERL